MVGCLLERTDTLPSLSDRGANEGRCNAHLILTSKEGLVGKGKLKGSLVCSDHEMVEFCIQRSSGREHSNLTTLAYGRADFALFRNLLGKVP